MRRSEADERPGVLRIEFERTAERRHRRAGVLLRQGREAGAVVRVHRELGRVKLRRPDDDFPVELLARFSQIALRQPDEAEQPVKALGRIALAQMRLPVLDDRAFAQHGLGAVERAAGDVDHRRLEMRERKVRVQLHRPRERAEPVVAPLRVRQAELMPPVAGLERDRPACSGRSASLKRSRADQQERQRRVRLGEVPLELDRAPDVIDRPRQQRRVGLVARARHLVLPEPARCRVPTCARA